MEWSRAKWLFSIQVCEGTLNAAYRTSSDDQIAGHGSNMPPLRRGIQFDLIVASEILHEIRPPPSNDRDGPKCTVVKLTRQKRFNPDQLPFVTLSVAEGVFHNEDSMQLFPSIEDLMTKIKFFVAYGDNSQSGFTLLLFLEFASERHPNLLFYTF